MTAPVEETDLLEIEELKRKLWFPGLVEKIIAKSQSTKSGTLASRALIGNFYKPIIELQDKYELFPDLVGFALARTLTTDIVERPNGKAQFRFTEQLCETNQIRFIPTAERSDSAKALLQIVRRLAKAAVLNAEGDIYGAKEQLRKAEEHIIDVSSYFPEGGAPEARNHLYEAFKRGMINFDTITPLPRPGKIDYLPDWQWPGTEKESSQEAEKESFKREMNIWVRAYGSDHLKQAHGAGHPVKALYAEERAREEFPAFAVINLGSEKPRPRANPTPASLEALKEAEERVKELGESYQPEIKYISGNIEIGSSTYSGEFVAIESYLNSDYTLLQPLSVKVALNSFTTRLSALIQGGEKVEVAWKQLALIEENPRLRSCLLEIYEKAKGQAKEIFQAIDNYPFIFPDFYRMMMKLVGDNYSETQSDLDQLILKALL